MRCAPAIRWTSSAPAAPSAFRSISSAGRGENDAHRDHGGLASAFASRRNRKSAPRPRAALRAARNFGDGFAVIILPAYLAAIGFDAGAIGIVAAAALLGSALLTLTVGLLAPRFDLRSLLLAGAFLMAATGLAMPNAGHLALILLIAFIGTMNPATGDLGVLVPIEHAMLAREAADQERTKVFARYSLIGTFASAAGALAAATPDLLRHLGLGEVAALQAMLYLYAALGLAGAACYRFLPRAQPDPNAPKQP